VGEVQQALAFSSLAGCVSLLPEPKAAVSARRGHRRPGAARQAPASKARNILIVAGSDNKMAAGPRSVRRTVPKRGGPPQDQCASALHVSCAAERAWR